MIVTRRRQSGEVIYTKMRSERVRQEHYKNVVFVHKKLKETTRLDRI